MLRRLMRAGAVLVGVVLLSQCAGVSSGGGSNMGGPTVEVRNAAIASEPTGDFFYARRYFVEKTRFWGYVRKPRQSWNRAKLVMMDESRVTVPDRLPESGPPGRRYAFDQNYEYRVRGRFTGGEWYDPNSNQFLPVFQPTSFELVERQPGWLFRPDDRYDRYRVTLTPR